MKRLLLWGVVGVVLLGVMLGMVTWILPVHLRWVFWATIVILAVLMGVYEFILYRCEAKRQEEPEPKKEANKKGS